MIIDEKVINEIKEILQDFIDEGKDYLQYLANADENMPSIIKKVMTNNVASETRKNVVTTQSIIDSISREGFKKVTNSFPLFFFSIFASKKDYPYLLISGIKRNAEEKQTSDVHDDVEENRLFSIERRMGEYIDKDLKISLENAEPFLENLYEYMEYYYYNTTIDFDENFDFSYIVKGVLSTVTVFIVNMNAETTYSEQEFTEMVRELFDRMSTDPNRSLKVATGYIDFIRKCQENIAMVDESIETFLRKGKREFKVSDSFLNKVKDNLNKLALQIEDSIKKIDSLIAKIEKGNSPIVDYKDQFESLTGTDLPDSFTKYNTFMCLKMIRESREEGRKETLSLKRSLTINGITKPTYLLPLLLWIGDTQYKDFVEIYLIIRGIKLNVSKNFAISYTGRSNEFITSEKENEMKLTRLIEDDFSIARPNILEFIDLFMLYLSQQGAPLMSASRHLDDEEIDTFFKNLFVKTTSYIIYANTGVLLDDKGVEYIKGLLDEGDLVYEDAVQLIDMVAKRCEQLKNEYESRESTQEAVETFESDPLDDYVKEGTIVKPCPLEEFTKMLISSNLDPLVKRDYEEQMRNLLARIEYEERLTFCKEAVFTDEEKALYEAYNEDPCAKDTIDNIDAIIEMFMGASDEDRLLLLDSLGEEFEKLREEKRARDLALSKVVYFTKETKTVSGTMRIPLVLDTVSKDESCDRTQIIKHLNRLISGECVGDKEIPQTDIPYKIYCKGKATRIFYIDLEEFKVVIDGGRIDEEKVLKTVKSQEFRRFFQFLVTTIESGATPEAEGYTSLIIDTLTKEEKRLSLK